MKYKFFEAAKEYSKNSTYEGAGNVSLGAVAVFRGTIIAKGCNQNKTHSLQQRYNKYRYNTSQKRYCPCKIHAEIDIIAKIRHLDIDFSKVSIYIYRETRDGRTAMARPCAACQKALQDLEIKKVFYTTNKGFCEEHFI